MTDVVDNQSPLVHTTGDFSCSIFVALPARGVGLDIGVWVHLDHVILSVIRPNQVAELLACLHVPVTVLVVSVLVVGDKQHAVAPRPINARTVGVKARRDVCFFLLNTHVCGHFAHDTHGRSEIGCRDSANPKLKLIADPRTLAFCHQREIVVRDVAVDCAQRFFRIEPHQDVSVGTEVSVFIRSIAHQKEVLRGIQGPHALV